jgi:uncharacterized protein (DUF488 family)
VVARVVSVGYEGLALDELVALLVDAGVEVLVDVRLNAVSRRPGFSKTKLAAALAAAGIEYRHERSLGNPVDNRDRFRRGDPSAWQRMRDRVAREGHDAAERVADLAVHRCVALLCVERDDAICHRRIVSDHVRAMHPDVLVVNPR